MDSGFPWDGRAAPRFALGKFLRSDLPASLLYSDYPALHQVLPSSPLPSSPSAAGAGSLPGLPVAGLPPPAAARAQGGRPRQEK